MVAERLHLRARLERDAPDHEDGALLDAEERLRRCEATAAVEGDDAVALRLDQNRAVTRDDERLEQVVRLIEVQVHDCRVAAPLA